jgi:hypothetical protein
MSISPFHDRQTGKRRVSKTVRMLRTGVIVRVQEQEGTGRCQWMWRRGKSHGSIWGYIVDDVFVPDKEFRDVALTYKRKRRPCVYDGTYYA